MANVELVIWETVRTKAKVCLERCRCSSSCLMVEEWTRPFYAPSKPLFSLILGPKDSNFGAQWTLDPKGMLAVGYFHGGFTEWEGNKSSPKAT